MPKLPVVSGRETVKALSKMGFVFKIQVGSQMVLKSPSDGKRIVIPDHRKLPKGTLRAILRQPDISVEEFVILTLASGKPPALAGGGCHTQRRIEKSVHNNLGCKV